MCSIIIIIICCKQCIKSWMGMIDNYHQDIWHNGSCWNILVSFLEYITTISGGLQCLVQCNWPELELQIHLQALWMLLNVTAGLIYRACVRPCTFNEPLQFVVIMKPWNRLCSAWKTCNYGEFRFWCRVLLLRCPDAVVCSLLLNHSLAFSI